MLLSPDRIDRTKACDGEVLRLEWLHLFDDLAFT